MYVAFHFLAETLADAETQAVTGRVEVCICLDLAVRLEDLGLVCSADARSLVFDLEHEESLFMTSLLVLGRPQACNLNLSVLWAVLNGVGNDVE